MMQCRDIDELLMDFLYGELDAEKGGAFRAHVDGCARCAKEVGSLSRTREALRSLPEAEPSPAVTARLLHEAGKRAETGGLLAWLHRMIGPAIAHPAWAAAASLLLVAGVAGFLSLKGRVDERTQTLPTASETAAASAPAAAAPPPRDLPAPEAKADQPPLRDVRSVDEATPSGYAPKVPAPAVAQPTPARAKEKARADADANRRLGRTASAEEDLKLAKPQKKAAPKDNVDSFSGAAEPPPAAPPAPAEMQQAAAPEGERELLGDDRAAEKAEAGAGPAATTSTRGYAAPSAPPPQTTTLKAAAQSEQRAKEPPEQELLRLAQKQASTGLCGEALGTGQKIARMNSEFYRKRVAGDPLIKACAEQTRQRPARKEAAPAALDEAADVKPAN